VRRPTITLGARGAMIWSDQEQCEQIPPFPVEAVDTTAAGDAFAAALAVALAEGRDWSAAARFACAAGALAATQLGAQPAMPLRAEVERLWSNG
jgi:ribokinase